MRKILLTLGAFFIIHSFALSQEKLVINTDRTIYIGGESIWLTVSNIKPETNQTSNLSKVAYIELLNNANMPVVQEKVYLKDGHVTSLIDIPDSVSTGNYLLRVYTRWMTNYSPDNYESKVISIVNPFANNSLPKGGGDNNVAIANDMSDSSLSKLFFKGLKSNYKHRKLVSFSFSTDDLAWSSLTVSVVKKCLYSPMCKPLKKSIVNPDLSIENIKVPEYKGEIIKGRVIDLRSNDLITKEKMMLSFVSQNPILKFSETDANGEFIFEANRFGRQEMVIQPYSPDTTKLHYKIELENNFSGNYSKSSFPELSLDTAQVNQINKAIVNMQINTIYASHFVNVAQADSIENMESFYGQPENTIVIDKYIDLPTTEEVVREIVPYVSLRKSKGQYEFRVYEEKSLYPKEGGTLSFVDGVPVRDIERILAIDPKYLEKVDVVNLNYFMKDENLGRLVLFYTRNSDMGNMEFDHRIFRQVYNGYLNSYTYSSPDYSNEELYNSRLADYRNVLYYASIADLQNKKQVDLEFYTSDDTSEYTVVITGINSQGERECATKSFVVE